MRERDVRNAIAAALQGTGVFDGVWISGLPEDYGRQGSQLAAVAIEPSTETATDMWDDEILGALVVSATVRLTFFYRHDDPQTRDEACEGLLNTAQDALNGNGFSGFCVPGRTRFTSWRWQQATPPERRIEASYQFVYVSPWAGFDTTA